VARSSLGPGLDGILVVAKPAGPTSHDVVALVRRLAATRRVGHGGTLDPFASGVLPVFLGHATRVVEYHLGDRKAYRATVCFGASSTTDDLEGELTPADGAAPTREAVEAALPGLRGTISQRPPAYSAIKVGGRRAYAIARAGETIELATREVTIHALDIVSWDGTDPDRPIAVLDVACSAGTYIRALARDLGAAVGSAAYLGALTRTASGPFTLGIATSLDEIRSATTDGPTGLLPILRPVDTGLDAFPVVTLTPEEVGAIGRGQFVRPAAGLPAPADHYRLRDPGGALVAIATASAGRLAPDKVFVAPVGRPAVPVG
jgi:tRNA pseudouridine55 synthase